jgi:hypothetical protein
MEMSVKITRETLDYLEKLVVTLYQKEYFSWLDLSKKYVDEILDDIKINLPKRPHKRAPERYARYGKDLHYASFVKNKRTTWYAFFSKYQDETGEIFYMVSYIGNNHTEAQYL